MATNKKCSRCFALKPLEEFTKNKLGKYGRHSHCKACSAEERRLRKESKYKPKQRIKGSKTKRDYYLRSTYGITEEQYNALLKKQKHSCAVCGKHEDEERLNLSVDHDHVTQEIRGLLCHYCNYRLIGKHRDGDLLRRMADYVEQGTGMFVPPEAKARQPKKRKKKYGR